MPPGPLYKPAKNVCVGGSPGRARRSAPTGRRQPARDKLAATCTKYLHWPDTEAPAEHKEVRRTVPGPTGNAVEANGLGPGESRLAALARLEAARGDVEARLRRPPVLPGRRYRDLLLYTQLIEFELQHVAAASHPWGSTARGRLHADLERYSGRRERLGRRLTGRARRRAVHAAEARYRAFVSRAPGSARIAMPHASAAGATRGRDVVGADPDPGIARAPRFRRPHLPGPSPRVAVAAGGALGALALLLLFPPRTFDGPGPRSANHGTGPEPQVAVQAPWAGIPGPPVEARPRQDGPRLAGRAQRSTPAAERNGDPGLEPEGEAQALPVATQTSVVPTAPAPAPTAPAPAPAPAPTVQPEPPAAAAPEFGFER